MSRDLTKYPDRCYMDEMEAVLQRNRSTIRTWEAKGWLPEHLHFHRDEANWRYWTRDQLEQAKVWLASRNQGRSRPRNTTAA